MAKTVTFHHKQMDEGVTKEMVSEIESLIGDVLFRLWMEFREKEKNSLRKVA